jgi:hypothetical protein
MTPEHTPHPMESWLRRYAQTRRQQSGPPFVLHPADKETLLAEARKVHAAPQTPPRPWWAFWHALAAPRWAMAAALLAVLGVAVYSLWLAERPGLSRADKTLALQKAPAGTVARSLPATVNPPAVVPEKESLENQPAVTRDAAPLADRATTAVLPTPPEAGQMEVKREEVMAFRAATVAEGRAADAAPPPSRAARAERQTEEGVEAVRRSAPPAPLLAAPPPNVVMRGASARNDASAAPPPAAPPPIADAVEAQKTIAPSVAAPAVQTPPVQLQSLADLYLAQQAAPLSRPAAAPAETRARLMQYSPGAAGGAAPETVAATAPSAGQFSGQAKQAAAPAAPPAPAIAERPGRRYVSIHENAPAALPATFHLLVSNDVVRVVDADGTVYEGRLENLPAPVAAASRRQTSEKASARELLSPSARKNEAAPPPSAEAGRVSRTFQVSGRHPRLQEDMVITGQWPPAPDGLLRLQIRLGSGPPQTLTVRPAEN